MAGLGAALIPEHLVAEEVETGVLTRLLHEWKTPGGVVHAMPPEEGAFLGFEDPHRGIYATDDLAQHHSQRAAKANRRHLGRRLAHIGAGRTPRTRLITSPLIEAKAANAPA